MSKVIVELEIDEVVKLISVCNASVVREESLMSQFPENSKCIPDIMRSIDRTNKIKDTLKKSLANRSKRV